MLCNKCGKELSEEAKFCPQCGSAVEAETSAKEETAEVSVQEEAVEASQEPGTFAEAMDNATAQSSEEAPAVTIAETEAENTSSAAVAVAEKEEEEQSESEAQAEEAEKQEKEAEEQGESYETAVVPVTEELTPAVVEAKTEKKSKKGLIIGASAAAVVLVGAGVGYFGFSNEIMRFFMGDAGFAEMIEKKSVEYIYGREIKTDGMDTVLADYVEQAFYGPEVSETDLTRESDELFSLYGDSSITLAAELNPGMLLSLADAESLLSNFKIQTVIEAVQGDDCDRFSYIFTDNGARVLGADMFIQEDRLAMLIPELTTRVFTISSMEELMEEAAAEYETEETEEKERVEFSDAEMRRIRKGLMNVYSENLKDADIEYTKEGTDLVIADCPIDSERVIIRLSAENLNSIFKEMADFLRNDEYLRNYYVQATGEEVTEYEKAFDEIVYETNAQVTVETYITDHAVITGKKVLVTYTGDETEGPFDMCFEITQGNFDMSMGNDVATVSLTNRKADETSGKMEFIVDIAETGAPFVLDVDYSGVGVAEYCGQPVNTGKYTIKISEKDQLIDYIVSGATGTGGENYDADMMSDFGSGMNLTGVLGILKDIKIEMNTECDGNSVKSSFTINIPLFFDIVLSAGIEPLKTEKPVMPDCTDAIDFMEAGEIENIEELQQEILNNLIALSEKNELIGMIVEYSGIKDEIEKLSVTESFKVHYGEYSDETRENADDVAKEIGDAFFFAVEEGYENITLDDNYIAYTYAYNSGEELKAKFYFDENGEIEVIDDGGYYFVDFEKIGEYIDESERPVNLYVEFISGALLEDGGVNVVYTDNPDDIPGNLPDMYNFYDGVFIFAGDLENATGEFILGTYPELSYGESDSEYKFMELIIEKESMDISAKKIAESATAYFEEKNNLFVNNEGIIGSVILKNNQGAWSFDGCYLYDAQVPVNEFFTQDITAEFTDYINQTTEAGHADAEIHFAADESGNVIVCGVGAVLAEHQLDFTGLGVPDSDHFYQGYCYIWNGALIQNSYITGLFRPDNEKYIPFGSWCSLTNEPLGGASKMAELLIGNYNKGGSFVSRYSEDEMNTIASDIAYKFSYIYTTGFIDMADKEFEETYYKYCSDYYDTQKFAVRLYYNSDGELEVITDEGYEFVDITAMSNEQQGSDYRNIYVEIRVTGALGMNFAVTAVETDSPDNLPELPDIYNFADGCFEWDTAAGGCKDGFVTGTYPVLAYGVSDAEQEAVMLKTKAELYNTYAEQIYHAADSYFASKGEGFIESNGVMIIENAGGKWKVSGFTKLRMDCEALEIFSEDVFADDGEFVTYLNQNLSIAEEVRAEIAFTFMGVGPDWSWNILESNWVSGVGVVSADSNFALGKGEHCVDSTDFEWGYCCDWNYNSPYSPYITGVIYGDEAVPYGSWCRITEAPLDDYDALVAYFD